jgi:hypothetical protein
MPLIRKLSKQCQLLFPYTMALVAVHFLWPIICFCFPKEIGMNLLYYGMFGAAGYSFISAIVFTLRQGFRYVYSLLAGSVSLLCILTLFWDPSFFFYPILNWGCAFWGCVAGYRIALWRYKKSR